MTDTIPFTIEGGRATVDFTSYDIDAYRLFLKAKALPESRLSYDWESDRYRLDTPARFARLLGVEVDQLTPELTALAGWLFDYQHFCVQRAIEAKRFALWADTGLGKTLMFLEFAHKAEQMTGAKVLIFSPAGQLIGQTSDMHAEFYGEPLHRLTTRDELAAWCATPGPGIAITNYEKMIPGVLDELRLLGGLVLDESSILKSGGGTIKWNLIKSAKGIEYKLSCTATPAPNDTMEYASQASFLEKLRTDEIIWTYFSKDKQGNWGVKPHARAAFYAFMASWSIYMRDPSHFGFADILATLPPPVIEEHPVTLTDEQRGEMFTLLHDTGRGMFDPLGIRERGILSQIAKGFRYEKGGNGIYRSIESAKPSEVARLVARHVRQGRQTIVWTIFDAESELIEAALREKRVRRVVTLHGKHSDAERDAAVRDFKSGEKRVLVTKAQLVGYGLNFQNARAMVFSGFDDSYERMYQAIRRAYRFGQTETVYVDVPVIRELEGLMLDNLAQKEERFNEEVAIQEAEYRKALDALNPKEAA